MLKVKGLQIYIPPLTGKPDQQRFTIRNGVLISTSSRRRCSISGHPLTKLTDFGPAVCSKADHYGLHGSSHNVLRQLLAIFSSQYYQGLIATHFPT